VVSEEGISTDPDKIKTVQDWPRPKTPITGNMFEFFIHFSCSFKFLIAILSFYCVFVHPCSIFSSYIRFVFDFDVYFLRFHSENVIFVNIPVVLL
jgi:hypothetical protein